MELNLTSLAVFDTTTLANQGVWMTLLTPTKQPTTFKLKLMGRDSERAKKISFKDLNLRIKANAASGKGLQVPPAEELDLKARWERAFLTLEWEGFTDSEGQPVACDPEKAFKIYSKFPDIDRQVEEFISDPKNFGREGEKVESIFRPELYMAEIAGN